MRGVSVTIRGLLATFALLVVSLPMAHAQTFQVNPETGESQEQFAARTKWWREAKFGMFIHWGIYAVPAEAVAGYPAEWYFTGYNENLKKHPELLTNSHNYMQT